MEDKNIIETNNQKIDLDQLAYALYAIEQFMIVELKMYEEIKNMDIEHHSLSSKIIKIYSYSESLYLITRNPIFESGIDELIEYYNNNEGILA